MHTITVTALAHTPDHGVLKIQSIKALRTMFTALTGTTLDLRTAKAIADAVEAGTPTPLAIHHNREMANGAVAFLAALGVSAEVTEPTFSLPVSLLDQIDVALTETGQYVLADLLDQARQPR